MQYNVGFNTAERIVEGKINGDVDESLIANYIKELDNIITRERCYKVLTDFRESKMTFSILQLFQLTKKICPELIMKHKYFYLLKNGLLINHDENGLYRFYETLAVNRGQNLKVFTERPRAIAWLQT